MTMELFPITIPRLCCFTGMYLQSVITWDMDNGKGEYFLSSGMRNILKLPFESFYKYA